MLERLYHILVQHTTKRPWTYMLRDTYHTAPLEWLAAWSLLVSVVANLVTAQWELVVWASLGVGALLGHLFWGTKWRRGQK